MESKSSLGNFESQNDQRQSDDSGQSLLDQLADSFVQRLRDGENPAIQSYIKRHPEIAEEIRDLFPTLAMLEQCGEENSDEAPRVINDRFPNEIAEYELIREVGRGGMGVVYEAEHATMGRRVALKILPRQFAEKETSLKRFHREARAAGRLHHTNIVPVFEVGEADGIHFYAMQYIHGQNLDVVIDEMRQLKNRTGKIEFSGAVTQAGSLNPGDHTIANVELGKSVAMNLVSGTFKTSAIDQGTQNNGNGRVQKSHNVQKSQNAAKSPTDTGAIDTDTHHLESTAPLNNSSELSNMGGDNDDYFQRVARVGLQVAEALEYAHSQGVMHRDIKPSNLILDTAGTVWVTDFGLAKNEGDNLTHTGDVVGTLRYMAPERFSGVADARGDLYSLGLTLYELCTLRYAFDQPDRASLVKQLTSSEPAKPRKLNPQIPRDLETIIIKCISRKPDDRYQSAKKLTDDLELFLHDRPILARRTSAVEHVWRWCRRNPELTSLALCVLVMMSALFFGSLRYGMLQNQHAIAKEEHADELQDKIEKVQAAEQKARRATDALHESLFRSLVDRARLGVASGEPGQHFETMDAIRRASRLMPMLKYEPEKMENEKLKLRNLAIRASTLFDIQLEREFVGSDGSDPSFSVNGDYTQYAWPDPEGNIAIRRMDNDELIKELPSPGGKAWIVFFSPDGRHLAAKHLAGGGSLFRLWNLESGELVIDLHQKTANANSSFSSDSSSIAVICDTNEIKIFDVASGDMKRLIRAPTTLRTVTYRPGHNQLCVVFRSTGKAIVWDLDNANDPQILFENQPAETTYSVADWTRDGKYLAIGSGNGNIDVWDVDQNELWMTLEGHVSFVSRLLFSNRGDYLISDSWDGTCRVWDMNRGVNVMKSQSLGSNLSRFRDDDRQILLSKGNKTYGIWNVASDSPLFLLPANESKKDRRIVSFHPVAEQLAVSGAYDQVEIWDVLQRKRLCKLDTGRVLSTGFSNDGKWLIYSTVSGVFRRALTLSYRGNECGIHIGKAELLMAGHLGRSILNSTSSHLGVAGPGGTVYAIDMQKPDQPIKFGRHGGLDHVRVSPNAQWVASSTWSGSGVRIWDLKSRKLVKDLLPNINRASIGFSPDGRFFCANTADKKFLFQVDNWELICEIECANNNGWPGQSSFSNDGRILMANDSRFSNQWLDVNNQSQLALFDLGYTQTAGAPDQSKSGKWFGFIEERNAQVWNITLLQEKLANMQLEIPGLGSVKNLTEYEKIFVEFD